jgi:hypothetical protein
MVIPLADGLNHANVDSRNHVLHKRLHLNDLNFNGFDFSDFNGVSCEAIDSAAE